MGSVPGARLRVRLKQLYALRVSSSDLATGAGRRLPLIPGRTYRLTAWQDGLQIVDLTTGHARAHFHGAVRLSPGSTPLRLLGEAENGVRDGRYRGALLIQRDGTDGRAINDVSLEDYLLGVVGGEMPASWPAAALRAQAVAARSYALRSRRPQEQFDVYADTRSQVYRGVSGEASATTVAVSATRGFAVLAGGGIAETLFHASSGGRTAAVEEVFLSSPPVPYLVSVDDPFDPISPHHNWTVRFNDADAARRLGAPGSLLDVAVLATTPTGRVRTVRVTGTLGVVDRDGPTVRTLLGLRSTWFTIAHNAD